MKKYYAYYLKGYLNEKINYHSLLNYQGFEGSFKSYKIKLAFRYLGLKQFKFDNRIILLIFELCDFIMSYIMTFIKFIKSIVLKICIKKCKYPSGKLLMLGIAPFTTYTKGVLKKEFPGSVTYLHIPFTPHENGGDNMNVLCCLSVFDLFKSLWASWCLNTFLFFKYGKIDCMFRAHSSYEFFLGCLFVEKTENNNTFVMCNIIDRWAFLISSSKARKIFIQHGKTQRTKFIKIGTPDIAYFMNDDQRIVHEEFIFKSKPNDTRVLSVFEYSGNNSLINNGKKNVLLVCNTLFIEAERRIIEYMANIDVNLYLKPHPLTKTLDDYEKMKSLRSFYYVPKGLCPKVDCVISYESTLADEYESVGAFIIRYDQLEKLETIVEIINNHIKI